MIGSPMSTEYLVQIGMRAAIRDIQEYVDINTGDHGETIDARHLSAYLLAGLVVAGAYEDPEPPARSYPLDEGMGDYLSGLRIRAVEFAERQAHGES